MVLVDAVEASRRCRRCAIGDASRASGAHVSGAAVRGPGRGLHLSLCMLVHEASVARNVCGGRDRDGDEALAGRHGDGLRVCLEMAKVWFDGMCLV